jgi:hypothetical protein
MVLSAYNSVDIPNPKWLLAQEHKAHIHNLSVSHQINWKIHH